MFGTSHLKSIKQPFYTYSMRDAIRDGLVLDVTQHYSTVAVLAKMSQSNTTSSACTTIEKQPPGIVDSATTKTVMSPKEHVSAPHCSTGALQVTQEATQCRDPKTPCWTETNLSSASQCVNPNTAVYSEARKAAYHVLRIPGNDVVFIIIIIFPTPVLSSPFF
jgi:hypothetical protein